MRAGAAALAVAVGVLCSGSASAKPPWVEDFALISKGISRAYDLGRIDSGQAGQYRQAAAGARRVLPMLSSSRYRNLAAVVHQVAGFWKGYDGPRGTTLFQMLSFNARWFATHWDQKPGTDAVDFSDGTWYRAFPGIGFQFHPLENFGKLNNFVTQKNQARASQLAAALLARAVPEPDGLGWEYYFRFDSGRPPWLSGMAQAVAAQALSRAGTQLGDPQLTAASQRVFRTVPQLTRRVDAGPWIRLYAFSKVAVLNAQLQTIVSLQDYAAQTNDPAAAALATQLQNAAAAMLPRFDTGAWSLYSLGGVEAPLDYHKFVVRLLTTLAKRTTDPRFATYAQKFSADLTTPPDVKTGAATTSIYPWPVDGYRDAAAFRIWLSKSSTVRVDTNHPGPSVVVSRGWHTIYWEPGKIPPATYTPDLHAVDVVGNASDTPLPAVEVLRDTQPPIVTASLTRRRLYWSGHDDASPWLDLRVTVLQSGSSRRTLTLRHEPFRGSVPLLLNRGARVSVTAADSSGNTAVVRVR